MVSVLVSSACDTALSIEGGKGLGRFRTERQPSLALSSPCPSRRPLRGGYAAFDRADSRSMPAMPHQEAWQMFNCPILNEPILGQSRVCETVRAMTRNTAQAATPTPQ